MASPAPASNPQARPPRPDWAPESHWDAEKGALKDTYAPYAKERDIFWATEQSRLATLPGVDQLEAKLPQDFQVPQGLEFKIDGNDPILHQLKQLVDDVSRGKVWGQAALERALAIHAGREIGSQQTLKGARDAEVAKLGPAGSARVTAIQEFQRATAGDDLAKHLDGGILTAKMVEGWEKILAAFRNQGAGSFSGSHRQSDEPARASPEQYAKMTYSERMAYAAKFPQPGTRPN